MHVTFEPEQVTTLREILQSTMKQLRSEGAHIDTRTFRETLTSRERMVESTLERLDTEPSR